jgi:hypothetical protein
VSVRAWCVLVAALAVQAVVVPSARADDDEVEVCRIDLGRGWPPATETYGSAVETLFTGDLTPKLSLTRLPARSGESALQLIAGEGEGDWTLRYVEADERIQVWTGGRRELRTNQQPEVAAVPMPAALARRVVADWQRVMDAQVPKDRAAEFHDDEVLLFVIGDARVSGLQPACGPIAQMMEQVALMIEATDDGDEKRIKRWRELGESLDQLEQSLAGATGAGAGDMHGEH